MKNSPASRLSIHRSATTRIAAALIVTGGIATAIGVSGASGASHNHAKSVVISTFKSQKFGTILTDGRTLYTLKPNASKCAAACHKYWIQVLLPKGVAKATAGSGVNSSKLSTVKVTDGVQVTFGGRPLFWFFLDKSPGQVKGNVTDTWGKWRDVVLKKSLGTSTTTTKPPTTTTSTKGTPTTTTTVKSAPTPTTTAPPGGGGGVGF